MWCLVGTKNHKSTDDRRSRPRSRGLLRRLSAVPRKGETPPTFHRDSAHFAGVLCLGRVVRRRLRAAAHSQARRQHQGWQKVFVSRRNRTWQAGTSKINLKGMLVGNGVLSDKASVRFRNWRAKKSIIARCARICFSCTCTVSSEKGARDLRRSALNITRLQRVRLVRDGLLQVQQHAGPPAVPL